MKNGVFRLPYPVLPLPYPSFLLPPAILHIMQEPHLTLAAHILLWVFPVVLVVLVVANLVRDSLAAEDQG